MSSPVKPRRRYDSSRRQEQAQHNRSTVLQAARQLFLEHGFAATTMPAIASTAGVSVQTVYKAFGNKPRLAKAVFDVAIAGDDEPVPILQRASLGRVRDEHDPREEVPALRRVPRRSRTTTRPCPTRHPRRGEQRSRGAGGVGGAPSRTTQRHDAVRPGTARRGRPAPRDLDERSPRCALDLQLR